MGTKILDEFQKHFWLGLLLFLLVSLLVFYRNAQLNSAYKQAKKDFELSLAEREARIGSLENEKAKWRREAEQNLKKANESAAEAKKIREAMAREEEENRKLRETIAVMPVDEIVSQFRLRLAVGESDVYRNELGFQFSIAAGRKALVRIADADYFSLVREPQYKALLAKNEEEKSELRGTIEKQDKALAASDAIELENKQIKIDYAELLKKSERQAKWLQFTIGGTTVAVVVAGLVFFLKK